MPSVHVHTETILASSSLALQSTHNLALSACCLDLTKASVHVVPRHAAQVVDRIWGDLYNQHPMLEQY